MLHASKVDDVATARHAIREGKVDLIGMTRPPRRSPHRAEDPGRAGGRDQAVRGATYCLDRIYQAARRCASTTPPPAGRRRCPTRSRGHRRLGGSSSSAPARVGWRRHGWPESEATTSRSSRPCPGRVGQIQLAARNPRRRDLMGIVEWREAELARGRRRPLRHVRRGRRRGRAAPDVVIIATGGLPQLPELEAGDDLVVTTWDVLGGESVRPATCSCSTTTGRTPRSAAELIARSGAVGDRHAGEDARHRGRRPQPRALRQGVQRDRYEDHAQPEGPGRAAGGRAALSTSAASTRRTGCPATSTRWWSTSAPPPPSSTSS